MYIIVDGCNIPCELTLFKQQQASASTSLSSYSSTARPLSVKDSKEKSVVDNKNNKALEYYFAAERKGHADAQCIVGLYYARGRVIQNDKQAVKWFREA